MRVTHRRSVSVAGVVLACCIAPALAQTNSSWLTAINGNWTDASKWSTSPNFPDNGIPSPGDTYTATIAATGGNYVVTLAGEITLSGFTLDSTSAALSHMGGTLNLLSGGQVLSGTYQLAGGTLTGGGSFQVASLFDWTGGTMAGAGKTVISSGGLLNLGTTFSPRTLSRLIENSGTVNLSAGSLILNGGTLNNLAGGVLSITAPLGFYYGGGPSLVANSGTIDVAAGFGSVQFSAPLVNNATLSVSSGSLLFYSGGTYSHNGGSRLTGPGYIGLGGTHVLGGVSVNFAGQNMELTSGTITGSGNLNLTGTLNWSGGTMTGSGAVTVAPGAVLKLGSTFSLRTLSKKIDNAGVTNFSAGSLMLSNGTFNNLASGVLNLSSPANFYYGGGLNNLLSNQGLINVNAGIGSVQINVPFVNNGSIAVNDGTLIFGYGIFAHNGGSALNGPGAIDFGTGTHLFQGTATLAGASMFLNNATLTGDGNANLTGVLNWNGGTIGSSSGTSSFAVAVVPGAVLNLGTTSFTRTLSREIDNSGTTNFSAGSLMLNGGVFKNLAGGVLNLSAPANFYAGGSAPLLSNQGLININAGLGSLTIGVPLLNSGTISVNTGSLLFNYGTYAHNGGSVLAGPAYIDFGSGTQLMLGTTTLAGANMNLTSGTLAGPGAISITGTFNWNGGTITGNGATTIAPGAVLNLGSTSFSRTLARQLDNAGTTNFNAATLTFNNGTFNNLAGAVLSISSPANFVSGGGTGLLANNGTILTLGGSGSILLNVPLLNGGTITAASGTLAFGYGTFIHDGGATLCGPGTIDLGSGTQLLLGTTTLAGSNVLLNAGNIAGAGSLNLASGTLNWNGGMMRDAGSVNIASSAILNLGPNFITRMLSRTLDNFGVTNFNAGSVILSAGTFNNRTGAVLNISSPTNFVGGGPVLLFNGGTMNLASGSINITVPFSNLGVLNVGAAPASPPASKSAGAIAIIDGPISQISGTTLTGGTWNIGDNSSLQFTSAGSIKTNQASVTLVGPGSQFPPLNSLDTNSGALYLLNGRSFSPVGAFTNTGVIHIDLGGALTTSSTFNNSGSISGLVISNGTMFLGGPNSTAGGIDGSGSVTVLQGANATVGHVRQNQLIISAGATLHVAANGGDSGVSRVGSLSIASVPGNNSQLDLNDNDLIVDWSTSSPLSTIKTLIHDGYANGAWTGPGINSTPARSAMPHTALGYAEASAVLGPTGGSFAGQSVDNTTVLVKYTYCGDANLDGQVDISDLGRLATAWQTSGVWSGGDFNYDGFIDISDLGLLATNWQAGAQNPAQLNFDQALASLGLPGLSVPEPAGLAIAPTGVILLITSGRRRLPAATLAGIPGQS